MARRYAKKRAPICAVQWLGGEKTPELVELLGQRGHYNAETGRLELGSGWYARPSDWIMSSSGEDLSVVSDECFRKIYEEVDEAGRTPSGDTRETALVSETARGALVVLARFNQSHELHAMQLVDFTLYLELGSIGSLSEAALRRLSEKKPPCAHPLNQEIDAMIAGDQSSSSGDLLAKVRSQCGEIPLADLRVAIGVHRANCHQPSCPVLGAMEESAKERTTKSALRTCPGCGRRFAMLYICERCGRCDAQNLSRDADRAACCAGDDTCVESGWRGVVGVGKESP